LGAGQGLRLLTPPISAPSLIGQIVAMQQRFPAMQWHTHAPAGTEAAADGASRVFGRAVETRYRFNAAQVVVALDGDFLDPGPQQVGVSRDWAEARSASTAQGGLLALHVATSSPNLTSAKADYPVSVPAAALPALFAALAAVATGGALPDGAPAADWVRRAGQALRDAQGGGIVALGRWQPAELQADVHRLNQRLGHVGRTIFYTAPALSAGASLAALATDMAAGKVSALVMLDTNPVYTAPGALGFADALSRVKFKLHAGLYVDETAIRADWHLPLKHPLESWGDPRAYDGTITLLQPATRPFYDGKSTAEVLSLLTDHKPRGDLDLLRASWKIDAVQWRHFLLEGYMPNTAYPEEHVTPTAASASTPQPAPAAGLTVLFRPDPTVWDGAVANNGWLQELPNPLTKVTWTNVIAIAPALATRMHLAQGDEIELHKDGRSLKGPVAILPGHAEDALTVTLGYGRRSGGTVSEDLGYDAYHLRPASGAWSVDGVRLRRTGGHQALATTETSGLDGDNPVRVQTPGGQPVGDTTAFTQPSFYNHVPNDGRSWGMAIDLDTCIGCNACVVACQAENNIPVVGRDQVREGRVLHWLRIDRHYAGAADDPRTHFMPVPCMHCENAPCELGCPVEATLHDHEGLNLQVYNRCIGTRACSSYCPYKVRHFNFLDYTANEPASIQAQHNPDVTVRARGVMEKCTYCVQRIVEARIVSDRSNQPIPDGTVKTACQQACPTRAITFGDMEQAGSAVIAAKRQPRNYALLGELNTRPHTTYLAAFGPAETTEHKG
jgi:Fe-S-cluster-containing dehydrogenase component